MKAIDLYPVDELVAGRSALDAARYAGRPLLEGASPRQLTKMADAAELARDIFTVGSIVPGPHQVPSGVSAFTAEQIRKALLRQAEEERARRQCAYEEAERQRIAAEQRQAHRDYRDRENRGRDFGETSRTDWDRHSSRERPAV